MHICCFGLDQIKVVTLLLQRTQEAFALGLWLILGRSRFRSYISNYASLHTLLRIISLDLLETSVPRRVRSLFVMTWVIINLWWLACRIVRYVCLSVCGWDMLAIIVWLVKCSTYIMCVRVPTCLSLPPLSLSTYTLARSSLFDIPLIAAVIRLLTAGLSNPSLLSVSPICLRQVMSTRIVNNMQVPGGGMLMPWTH